MATITEYIEPILRGENLTFEQATRALDVIFEGEVPEIQIAAFLTAMRCRPTTAGELAGLAMSLRQHAVKVNGGVDNLVDTCGTGGAAVKTFNISTAAALVAAGAGVYVAKHGNRAITSKCGSADVLAELGVNIEAGPESVGQCIREAGIGFMFAPKFHPAMKYVQPVRKGLGFRTVFNFLGPLANPAGVKAQVLGVADQSLMPVVAEALNLLGTQRAMIVHSNGLDEISITGPTKITELDECKIREWSFSPSDYGIKTVAFDSLSSGDAKNNADIIKNILNGVEKGPRKDIVVLNAAAAIIVGGLAENFGEALRLARQAIDNGQASQRLEKMIEISKS
ncbi:MAG: anthranilate phosphoribosyltransferase [Sedimentisphaerales bacterium]|nr:anthranilate phosphoribosyltransferase [Sedimentisphaerales bacterium]